MQKLIVILLLLPNIVWSQVYLKNNQTSFKVSGDTKIKIAGHLKHESDKVFQNKGQITLSGDLLFTGENSYYAGEGSLIFQGVNSQTLQSDNDLTIHSLKIDNNAQVILATNLQIVGALDLNHNSKITLQDYDLLILSTAQLHNFDSLNYVLTNGLGTLTQEVGSSEVIFPIGNGSYNPAKLQNQGVLDNFSIRVEDGSFQNYNLSLTAEKPIVKRTWFIQEENQGDSDVNLSLQWNDTNEPNNFGRDKSRLIFLENGEWYLDSLFSNAEMISTGKWEQNQTNLKSFNNSIFLVEAEITFVDNAMLVYPNPTNGVATLLWEGYNDEHLQAIFYSQQGKIFWAIEGSLEQINQQLNYALSSKENGIYFLRIQSETRDLTRKIVLIR